MTDRTPSGTYEDSAEVLEHLQLLDSMSAEQMVNLMAFVFDKATSQYEAYQLVGVIENYAGNRPPLKMELMTLEVNDTRDAVRINAIFSLQGIADVDLKLAEKWARQLIDGSSLKVRRKALRIIGSELADWRSYGASEDFVSFVDSQMQEV